MAMVSVVNWQPKGGLMVQVDRLGPKVATWCCAIFMSPHRFNDDWIMLQEIVGIIKAGLKTFP